MMVNKVVRNGGKTMVVKVPVGELARAVGDGALVTVTQKCAAVAQCSVAYPKTAKDGGGNSSSGRR
jgi:hypothetical protein